MISAIRAVVLGESECVVAGGRDDPPHLSRANHMLVFRCSVYSVGCRRRLTGKSRCGWDGCMQASSNFKRNNCLFCNDDGNRARQERRKR